jgi:hypothetical protein
MVLLTASDIGRRAKSTFFLSTLGSWGAKVDMKMWVMPTDIVCGTKTGH